MSVADGFTFWLGAQLAKLAFGVGAVALLVGVPFAIIGIGALQRRVRRGLRNDG